MKQKGEAELVDARKESRQLYWMVGIFSFFVNLLMLTGPLYMLNVYDRVLSSRSFETLIALSVLVAFLYSIMGILDYVRGRVMGRVGARFQARLDRRVFGAVLRATTLNRAPREAATGLRDLEAVQRLITSPALMALFDLPWAPLFFWGIFIFHPLMGLLAIVGAVILIGVALFNQLTTKKPLEEANAASFASEQMGSQIRGESEMVHSLGMRGAAFDRWQIARGKSLDATIGAADASGTFTAMTKSFRLFLQSAMLGLGAYLVLMNELSPGAMIAGSILLGRGLAPIELLVGQWAVFQKGREGWRRLAVLLGTIPEDEQRMQLPKPKARLLADQVTVVPPGEKQASLRLISFEVKPGQAVGVIGTSGAGKSTLARVLTGVWQPAGGKIRLDGAALDQYDPDVLGQHIGYLPQRVQLFDGTIKENIARMSMQPDDAEVVKAARKAAAHEMILKLPDGYDTRVSANTGRLSGGQIQRIGLARAMYGDPVVLVLDEPNSNLDNDGSSALNQAIKTLKSEGKIVFIMAHRPAAIQECDMLLVIEAGARRAFGPKDEVLSEMVKNHNEIKRSAGKTGGVS
ncbi:type I secretion system permease/ATPase [Yoonia sediminilitoris]|uniref:ATP-binding cassette subfamily C protein n=1 Tax=Yoonia sediminilitoris TaxID=1286148 RepID=A0A2T6KIH9_9RHOB|nr:type I secretion system permease/ATPase [Yoonia sediminilitoris]PUB15522.1 ATP-binding cassette subfamily C protein [Yoonia sediminilitoris]RCW96131.1 ATP-binding cassette subfamily C protein [Yoonia sediminilitoris]